jgi:hypothetical protein
MCAVSAADLSLCSLATALEQKCNHGGEIYNVFPSERPKESATAPGDSRYKHIIL